MKTFIEHNNEVVLDEAVKYHVDNGIPLTQSIFRMYSENFFNLFNKVRALYESGEYSPQPEEVMFLKTDIGQFGLYEGEEVPLDLPLLEEKDVELNKPKRGGPKKFYVYVRDPQTKKIKKVTWGDTTGLKVKLNDPAARKSFAARHKCSTRNDKTKASYWACRLPRYAKELGLSVDSPNGFW